MPLEHGRTRYTRGCRCAVCKAAERDYHRARIGISAGSQTTLRTFRG